MAIQGCEEPLPDEPAQEQIRSHAGTLARRPDAGPQGTEQLGADGRIDPEAFAIRSDEASRLRQSIQRLPSQYRIVLVLRDMEGLTDDEVAEITGLKAGTVRVRLHRARLFVRKELMKLWKPRSPKPAMVSASNSEDGQRPPRCKAMFAELSNYLDEQMDDSLCDELERHICGCEPCKVFLATLEATIEECRKSPADCPTRQELAKLRAQLVEGYKRAATAVRTNS